jgi:galactokinase
MTGYKIKSGSIHGLIDSEHFIGSLDESVASLPGEWSDLFTGPGDLIVTRAPGRLDVMGGIADYSGSLVLQLPIRNAVHVACQRADDNLLRLASLPATPGEQARLFEIKLEEFLRAQSPIDYPRAQSDFARDPERHWAAYVAGAFLVLKQERGVHFSGGAHLLIESTVPEGKGVSSSAALEVAAMEAIAAAYEIEISGQELALLCQKVENLVVGAPCGVMDQMTAACGEANRLLELLCQPAELNGTLGLPQELKVWGIDSGIRHSVRGADYRTVRTAAFMGYCMIADVAGLARQSGQRNGHIRIDDPKWKGYLANIATEEFEREFAPHLPRQMTGEDFLKRYAGITDLVTSVEPGIDYPIAAATRHPIYEHARVKSFASILKGWRGIEQAPRLGELMFESHESYGECGLGSDGTDAIVSLARASTGGSIFGAKITGGGSGGTVAVLGRREAEAEVSAIVDRYYERTGHRSITFSGSSPGSQAFGHLRLTKPDQAQ